MTNAFGIEHEVSKARDYSAAQEKWRRHETRANRVENAGQTTAGLGGAALGGAALREAAFKDYPAMKQRMVARATALPPRVGESLVRGKPGFKGLAVAAGGTAVAAAGTRSKKIAHKKVKRYEEMSKAFDEPGGLMHQADIAKGIRPEPNDPSIKSHKKVQGALGTTAAVTGLAAAGSKVGGKALPKLLPKLMATGRGGAYQKHLDRTADALLYGASAIGGASGIHQAQIMGAEGKQRRRPTPVAKAVDVDAPAAYRRARGQQRLGNIALGGGALAAVATKGKVARAAGLGTAGVGAAVSTTQGRKAKRLRPVAQHSVATQRVARQLASQGRDVKMHTNRGVIDVSKMSRHEKHVAGGTAAGVAAVGAAEVGLRVKPLKVATKFATEGEKAFHGKLTGLKPGVHNMAAPVEGLVPHFRGTGRRINNRKHIGDVAHKIQTNGWQKDKKVTVKVYDDGVRIKDGMHRLHAARSLQMKKVPTAVVREPGKAPQPKGIGGALDELTRRRSVKRIQRGKSKPVPVAPHSPKPFEAGFNTWRSMKGERAAQRSVRRAG